jgi:hypothetical protein
MNSIYELPPLEASRYPKLKNVGLNVSIRREGEASLTMEEVKVLHPQFGVNAKVLIIDAQAEEWSVVDAVEYMVFAGRDDGLYYPRISLYSRTTLEDAEVYTEERTKRSIIMQEYYDHKEATAYTDLGITRETLLERLDKLASLSEVEGPKIKVAFVNNRDCWAKEWTLEVREPKKNNP